MPAGSLTGIVLESDDLDSDIVRLAAHGVSVEGDMVEQPWGRSIAVADPDGNRIILQTTKSMSCRSLGGPPGVWHSL